jgi:very-short-patch-repair endonuclease
LDATLSSLFTKRDRIHQRESWNTAFRSSLLQSTRRDLSDARVDLGRGSCGDAIDQALRTRATTLTELNRTMELTAARVGNRVKRQLLLDSRAEPWSKAERFFHRLLRDARITGWRANRPVVLRGSRFFVDVIFRELKLVIEIDGRLYHDGTEVFERDRWRQNLLVLDGWCVLRFTWAMIEERPEEVIAMVREAIEMLTAAAAA